MPTKQEIDAAIMAVKYAVDNKIRDIKTSDAMIILYAYREELYKSMGLKEFNDGK